jgi:hypothetical protein
MDKNVIFVIDFPELDFDPRVCSSRPFREKPSNSECKISKKIVLARQSVYRKAIAEIKQRNPKLLIFDSAQVLCDKEFCYGRDANSIYYFDNDHLSVSGSSKILNELIKNSKNVQ